MEMRSSSFVSSHTGHTCRIFFLFTFIFSFCQSLVLPSSYTIKCPSLSSLGRNCYKLSSTYLPVKLSNNPPSCHDGRSTSLFISPFDSIEVSQRPFASKESQSYYKFGTLTLSRMSLTPSRQLSYLKAVSESQLNLHKTKSFITSGTSPLTLPTSLNSSTNSTVTPVVSPKTVTNDIVAFYNQYPRNGNENQKRQFAATLASYLRRDDVKAHTDGMHVITILFQSARVKEIASTVFPVSAMIRVLKAWDREWSERDISTFVYGIRSLDCYSEKQLETQLLLFAAEKISQSKVIFTSSRSIGNALYGLQDITSNVIGVNEICSALAAKIETFQGDLSGQDIGIGLYGLQGVTATSAEVRKLISILAEKISKSETEFDSQALSNSLYGLQSMGSEYKEVLSLVSALATKVSQARPVLIAQAIGSALYGLQRQCSDELEVRTLVATLAEKIEASTAELDPQAIGNSLFGLQRMKSDSPEVRALVQALANKIALLKKPLDSAGIGAAIYGLRNMDSESAQVRSLLAVLAKKISVSDCELSGQAIADSLYGLRGMKGDCDELRQLLLALSGRIDARRGKLEAQEIGNALFGLQSLSSESEAVRILVSKLAEKVKRSKVYLRPQHIARAMLGFQRLSSNSPEVRNLLVQMTKRISESDRTPMTAASIADSLYGLQGLTSDVPEVQNLVGELAKKVSSTAAQLNSVQIGRALFGLQGLSSSASIFEESAIGIDVDEVQFLLSALWDKIKISKEKMPLSAIAMGLQGLTLLNDPISSNIKQYLYLQLLQIPSTTEIAETSSSESDGFKVVKPTDVIAAVRGLSLNGMAVPEALLKLYEIVEERHRIQPINPLSRQDRLIVQRYVSLHPNDKDMISNKLIDGIRTDMYFRDIGQLVELDGASHLAPARARFDKERDDYLSKRLGLKVKRIPIKSEASTDEIVRVVREFVEGIRDKKAEQEVQRLYASDKEIQKLYSKKK